MKKFQISLSNQVFTLLHDRCLELVEDACDIPTKLTVRQRYGFDADPAKPSLKSLVDTFLASRKDLRKEVGTVNTKYFYDRYCQAKKGEEPIKLESYHAWLYFMLLGYEDLETFIKGEYQEGRLSKAAYNHQEELSGDRSGPRQGKGHFACYHYSTLWHGLYAFLLEVDYESIEYQDTVPVFQVTAISAMRDKEQIPIKYNGTVAHQNRHLVFDLQSTQRGSGMMKIVFPQVGGLGTIQDDIVLLGAYLGISRNTDIITGTIAMIKASPDEDIKQPPLEIARYLYLDKWQKRVNMEPLGYELTKIPLKRDSEGMLAELTGYYRFCWLTSVGDMIESKLLIKENYEFVIHTFMSKYGVYSGRFFVQNNVACLNSIGLRDKNPGKKLSAAMFLDITRVVRHEPFEFLKGVYILAGVTGFPKSGFCLIQPIEEHEYTRLTPDKHDAVRMDDQHPLKRIYNKLKSLTKREMAKIQAVIDQD